MADASKKESSEKYGMQDSRYLTKYITALRCTRWLQSTATTSSLKENPRKWIVWMRYLDNWLWLEVLGSNKLEVFEHGRYLKGKMVDSKRQGDEWMEDPRQLAATVDNR